MVYMIKRFLLICAPSFFCRERVCTADETDNALKRNASSLSRATVQSPPKSQATEELQSANRNAVAMQTSSTKPKCGTRTLLKSDSICASMCVGLIGNDRQVHALWSMLGFYLQTLKGSHRRVVQKTWIYSANKLLGVLE